MVRARLETDVCGGSPGGVASVLERDRHKGMASSLIKRAMEGMAYYKAKQGFLEVRVTNEPAIALYKKLGFEITRTINGYYSDGEDAYVMTKRL